MLRLALEGLGGAAVQDLRWALSPHHRSIGLRAFASQNSKLPTQPEPPNQVCENRAMAICPRKSKSRFFQCPEGWGRGMGRRRGEATTVPARRGWAAAVGTGASPPPWVWTGVSLRGMPPSPPREEALLAQSHVAGDRFISCHDQRLCRRQSLLAGAS